MKRAAFSRLILCSIGGTYADVNRLEEEGRRNAEDAHRDEWKAGLLDGVAPDDYGAFAEYCYEVGRDFVWDNMFDLFKLEHPENAGEQRRINVWKYYTRNISNVGNVLSLYGAELDDRQRFGWDDIREVGSLLSALLDLCKCAGIDVKEV